MYNSGKTPSLIY